MLCWCALLQAGGLPQLLDLLESKQINLQHNAAFALYGLSDNEDNIPCIVQAGGLQRLYDCSERLQVQASKVRTTCIHGCSWMRCKKHALAVAVCVLCVLDSMR